MVLALVRRCLFVGVLLMSGVASVIAYWYLQAVFERSYLAIFAMSADAAGSLLIIWCVSRINILRSWNGFGRAGTYFLAYAVGEALQSRTQNTVDHGRFVSMPKVWDLEPAAFDVLTVLAGVVFLAPVAFMARLAITAEGEEIRGREQSSLRRMAAYATVVAIACVWIRFLGADQTRYRFDRFDRSKAEVDIYRHLLLVVMPIAVPHLCAAMVMMYGFANTWHRACIACVGALSLDFCVTFFVTRYVDYSPFSLWHWTYPLGSPYAVGAFVLGRTVVVALAFITARFLGLTIVVLPKKVTAASS
ncbi:MAG: hypothetical protein U0795_19495 [Pirellulales bacterium]